LKNSSKLIKYIFIVLFTIIIFGGIYLKSSDVLHIVDKVYSPDKATRQVVYVYNKNLSGSKEEFVEIKVYDNTGRYNTSYSFNGKYNGVYWTSDSSKYVIKAKEYKSNIYVVDRNSGNITGIDKSLDLALQAQINDNLERFDFEIDKEFHADYEFIRWEKNSEAMLI
jgi:hypothetical protein